MPDQRLTPTLDDFQRAPEAPLCDGGNWGCALSSDSLYWTPMQLVAGFHATHAAGSVSSDSYWAAAFDGSFSFVEVWAIMGGGGGGSGDAYSLDLWQQPGGNSAVDGYRFRQEDSPGGNGTSLYRVTNAGFTQIGTGTSVWSPGNIMLMRIYNDGTIQCYGGAVSGPTLVITTTDTTHQGSFHPGIGIVDNSVSGIPFWTEFGGGGSSTHHTRIIRWVKN